MSGVDSINSCVDHELRYLREISKSYVSADCDLNNKKLLSNFLTPRAAHISAVTASLGDPDSMVSDTMPALKLELNPMACY